MKRRSRVAAQGSGRNVRKGESGQIFPAVVIFFAVTFGSGALAVDLASYIAERRDLQNAADAIALAAAQNLPNVDQVNATASSWKTKNGFSSATMTVNVTHQNMPDTPNPIVKITLTTSHDFRFGSLIGISDKDVSATAKALRSSPGGGDGLVPWSVQKTFLNGITPGQSIVMKYDSQNTVSGNFGAVQIDGSGATLYRDSIKYGSDGGLCATDVAGCPYPSVISLETGNMVGPTRAATDWRIENTTTACDTWDETVVASGTKQFIKPECNPWSTGGNPASLRLVVIPVINNLCNGSCNVTITEFALFFLEGYGSDGCTGNDCNIRGRFISSNTNYGSNLGVFNANSLAHFVKLSG